MTDDNQNDWVQLGIVCPSCGNCGADEGPWLHDAIAPFDVIEEITRAWPLASKGSAEDGHIVIANAARDHVDWETGVNRRLQCSACLTEFPIPVDIVIEFE